MSPSRLLHAGGFGRARRFNGVDELGSGRYGLFDSLTFLTYAGRVPLTF